MRTTESSPIALLPLFPKNQPLQFSSRTYFSFSLNMTTKKILNNELVYGLLQQEPNF